MVDCGENILGNIACIEFFESYSSLTFGLFQASSALYHVLKSKITKFPLLQVKTSELNAPWDYIEIVFFVGTHHSKS